MYHGCVGRISTALRQVQCNQKAHLSLRTLLNKNSLQISQGKGNKYLSTVTAYCSHKFSHSYPKCAGLLQSALSSDFFWCSSTKTSIHTCPVHRNIDQNEAKGKVYDELYLFQRIRFLRLLNRTAKYSVLAFALGAPCSLAACQMDLISSSAAASACAWLGVCLALFVGQAALFSSQVVGKIMISSDNTIVKVSHLSVFGNRCDIYVSPLDFVPVSGDVFAGYLKVVRFRSNKKRLLFLPEYGGPSTQFEAVEQLLKQDTREKK